MTELLSLAQIGVISSIVIELVKFVPAIKRNKVVVGIISLLVTALFVLFTSGVELSLEAMFIAFGTAFLTYKSVIKPVAEQLGLASQE